MATRQAFKRNLRDRDLQAAAFALPAAASTTVTSAAVDTGARTAFASFEDDAEAVLTVPALSTTILPDTRTATLSIEQSDSSTFASGVDTLFTTTLTGAGGVGVAVVTEVRVGLGSNLKRYVRGKVAFGASTTTGAALNANFGLVF